MVGTPLKINNCACQLKECNLVLFYFGYDFFRTHFENGEYENGMIVVNRFISRSGLKMRKK
jgi:hypothetical protein